MKAVLIIDDDRKNIFALAATLKAKGFHTLSATTATEGMQILREQKGIGIVLMDMMMPDMDGYETIKMFRSNDQLVSLPIVAVTAQAMKGDREKCLAAGADDYISKPVDVDILLAILQRYIK